MQAANRKILRLAVASLGAVALLAPACGKRAAAPTEVVAVHATSLPIDPADVAWRAAPAYTAALVLQDLVEPRLLQPSTPSMRVQALTDGTRIAFRLTWTDSTQNDLPGAARFTDACAVQFPAVTGPNLPAPQMGELNGRVEITYWTASWQAEVNGRGDSIQALYPNASVDHYPFDAASLAKGSQDQVEMEKRYAPAHAVEHPTHPPGQPVQDLIAEGPGTLTPAPTTRSDGRGVRVKTTWEVVIVRTLPEAWHGAARSQVAFAVWDGAKHEVGARKMRSVWIPLSLGVHS